MTRIDTAWIIASVRKRLLVVSLFCICFLVAWFAAKLRASVTPRQIVLWAWERPEDLRFLEPGDADVAFLAQTVTVLGNEVEVSKRHQPLRVKTDTRLIAVTRIEVPQTIEGNPQTVDSVVDALAQSAELPQVGEIQIDFDATLSQREFYAQVVKHLRPKIGAKRLSITALASWCMNDGWIRELPIDAAIPMVFQMGPDDRGIRKLLASGDDWTVESCRGSYGVSTFERAPQLRSGRAIYVFNVRPWTRSQFQQAIAEVR